MPVSIELWIFLWSICGGIILGFVFDLFRIKRRIVKTGIVLLSIEDLLYWIFAAFLLFLTLYLSNEGQMRWFSIFGSILGAVFYLSAISPIVLKVSVAVIDAIIRGFKFLVKILSWPIKFLIKLLSPIVRFIYRFLYSVSGKCTDSVIKNTKLIKKRVRKKIQKHKEQKLNKKTNSIFKKKLKYLKKIKRKFSIINRK